MHPFPKTHKILTGFKTRPTTIQSKIGQDNYTLSDVYQLIHSACDVCDYVFPLYGNLYLQHSVETKLIQSAVMPMKFNYCIGLHVKLDNLFACMCALKVTDVIEYALHLI